MRDQAVVNAMTWWSWREERRRLETLEAELESIRSMTSAGTSPLLQYIGCYRLWNVALRMEDHRQLSHLKLDKLARLLGSSEELLVRGLATVVICLVQSWFVIGGTLSAPGAKILHAGVDQWFSLYTVVVMVSLTAGTMFIMWLGEQITEHGIGNGISLIIMAGIIANLAPAISGYVQTGFGTQEWQGLLLFLGAWGVTVIAVVFMTKAQRRIPIQQAKQARGRQVYGGQKTYLPFKVNQAGVMPIIFGSALTMIPAMLGTAFSVTFLEQTFGQQQGFWFVLTFAALIYFFAFFWTSMMFQPNEIAKNLQEGGSFIPGIRPGKPTAHFLEQTMVRITLAGSTFLAVIAVMPSLIGSTGNTTDQVLIYFMSGTSILIVVGVALDMVEKINALLVMRNYEGAMTEPGGPGAGAGGGGQAAGATSGWGRRSQS